MYQSCGLWLQLPDRPTSQFAFTEAERRVFRCWAVRYADGKISVQLHQVSTRKRMAQTPTLRYADRLRMTWQDSQACSRVHCRLAIYLLDGVDRLCAKRFVISALLLAWHFGVLATGARWRRYSYARIMVVIVVGLWLEIKNWLSFKT